MALTGYHEVKTYKNMYWAGYQGPYNYDLAFHELGGLGAGDIDWVEEHNYTTLYLVGDELYFKGRNIDNIFYLDENYVDETLPYEAVDTGYGGISKAFFFDERS